MLLLDMRSAPIEQEVLDFTEYLTASMSSVSESDDMLITDKDRLIPQDPESFRTSNKIEFNQIEVTTRLEDNSYSAVWRNRMNNCSIALHKFNPHKFVVELSTPAGHTDAINFKEVTPAAHFMMLNTDVTRMGDEVAAKARRYLVGFIKTREKNHLDLSKMAFPKGCWQINKLRGQDVKFTDPQDIDRIGILHFLMPGGKKVLVSVQDTSEKTGWKRMLVDIDKVWF